MPHTYDNFAVVIPARYSSSRYPGKPLVEIAGKSLIRRVWERCVESVDIERVYIATDDERISIHCKKFMDNVVMTSKQCITGTDRVAEVAEKLDVGCIINVQGDEPLINSKDINKVIDKYESDSSAVVNAMCIIDDEKEFYSRTVPKVVCSMDGGLLYMSRSTIPGNKFGKFIIGWKQVCIYAFPIGALLEFKEYGKKTPLEEQEDIEILRFLELGYRVKMVAVEKGPVAVDTPEDRVRVEQIITNSYR